MNSSEKDISSLWMNYSKDNSLASRHKLLLHYIWLVKYVLQTMNLPSHTVLEDKDFLSIGILGLNEAIERFDLERGVKFESYAIPRIKGIIQDELRKLDWLSRTTRKKAQDFIQAGDFLRSQEGREVTFEEIRQKLNLTPTEYQSYLAAAAAAKSSMSLADSNVLIDQNDDDKDILEEIADPSEESSLTKIENEERLNFISNYLKNLNDRKRQIMVLYYYENLTFKDIGKTLKVSESRICQIHSEVVSDMRFKLKEFDNA